MLAVLHMYAHPNLDDVYKRYWALIRANLAVAGINSPSKLSQHIKRYDAWKDPELVFSQTCGMPYRNTLHDQVTLTGTPDFGVENCQPGYYRSVIIVRKDDPRTSFADFKDARFAFNGEDSQSGYAAAHTHAAKFGFWFDQRIETGMHQLSAKMIADGEADIAALDAVTWRIMMAHDNDVATALRILDVTDETPGLPYISAVGADREAMFEAVSLAIDALAPGDRDVLGLKGLVYIPPDVYMAVPNPGAQ